MARFLPRYRGFGGKGGWGAADGRGGAGQVGECAVFGNDVWENVGLGEIW